MPGLVGGVWCSGEHREMEKYGGMWGHARDFILDFEMWDHFCGYRISTGYYTEEQISEENKEWEAIGQLK